VEARIWRCKSDESGPSHVAGCQSDVWGGGGATEEFMVISETRYTRHSMKTLPYEIVQPPSQVTNDLVNTSSS
jgi:hypothetical protein